VSVIERAVELLKQGTAEIVLINQGFGSVIEEAKQILAQQSAQATAEESGFIDLDLDPEPNGSFLPVALRAIARGQRVLPIAVGGKNPLIKWVTEPTPVNLDTTSQWSEHAEAWVKECAAKFPDANVCVVAKPSEFCFIDEDASDAFRSGYEEFAGEALPRTFTTESRPNHKQSHWLQTDKTRSCGNIAQVVIDGKQMMSFRQDNLYVLSEGSRHPSGPIYLIVDEHPAIAMPDKLVEYMQGLDQQAQAQQQPKSSLVPLVGRGITEVGVRPDIDVTPDGAQIPYGSHDATLTKIAGKIHLDEPNLTEAELDERLIAICESRCTNYGADYKAMTAKIAHSVSRYEDKPAVPLTDAMKERMTQADEANKREKAKIEQPQQQGALTRETLDREFPSYDGKAPAKPRMIIENFLVSGTSFFGSLPGVGKSWVALSVAKALTTGKNLFGDPRFQVLAPTSVLYLCPESDESTFKYRLGVMKITQDPDMFRYRTVSQGSTLALTDERTLAVIRLMSENNRRVLVIIDTAIRFMAEGSDEKSATDNSLAHDAEVLRAAGADVLFLHHSTKVSAKAELTLENALRGTGDFSAMADCVFGMRRDEQLFDYSDGPTEIECACVKTRAPEWPKTFRLRLTRMVDGKPVSVIDETGDLQIVRPEESAANLGNRLSAILSSNAATSTRHLKEELHIGYSRIKKLADEQGWRAVVINTPDGRKTVWNRVCHDTTDGKIEADVQF
jgi:hypothetical protein